MRAVETVETFGRSSVAAVFRLRGILVGSVPRPSAVALLYFQIGDVS
ncbi:MAG TPA: hypothetical protein VGX23_10115 [Actinocrinis sp.]|nr:hypothetical protein [Actinocrinis sp.]